ncbi:MAG: hypothetical protein ACE5LB_02785 [Acidiferrobacterales bacterium]
MRGYLERRRARSATGPLFVLSLLVALAAVACTPQQMHRPDNIVKGASYTLGFIEFDDYGEPWSPHQTERVLEVIERANQSANGAIVVVFVHGWQNDASQKQEQQEGRSLNGFNKLLTETATQVAEAYPIATPEVIGVFISWRGRSAKVLQAVTFYGRRRAAERIAGPAATGAIFEILAVAKESPKTRVALIGHSFGGLVVEEVVSDVMAGVLLGSTVQVETEFPADIVVLINPASASVYAKQFIDLLARDGVKLYRIDAEGKRYERPLMVSVTSEADSATRVLFPVGTKLGSLGKRYRKYGSEFCSPGESQRKFFQHTAGHTDVLHSHVMTQERLPSGTSEPGANVQLRVGRDPYTGERTFSFTGLDYRYTVIKKPRALNETPYWIMRVPKSLIPDHSDIFGRNTLRLLAALVQATGALARDSRTVLVKEGVARPIDLIALPYGDLLVIDQLRRLYTVSPGTSRPIFLACYPHAIDPGALIGAVRARKSLSLMLVLSHLVVEGKGKKKKTGYRTEVVELANVLAPSVEKPIILEGSTRFLAATGDLQANKVYLVSADGLYVADLSKKKPKPTRLAYLDASEQLGWVNFDPEGKRVLIPDAKFGRLYVVDLTEKTPQVRTVATGLGWPTDVDLRENAFYLPDAKGKRIWRVQCEQARCAKPQVFAKSDRFRTLNRIEFGIDGTLWLADPGARKVFGVGLEGRLDHAISWGLQTGG